jgi:chemotaxis protein histidine kinase CheA
MNDQSIQQPGKNTPKTPQDSTLANKSEAEMAASLACDPLFRALSTTQKCAAMAGGVDLVAYMQVLRNSIGKVTDGDLQSVEATLAVQANTLDALFNELARRAMIKDQYLSATESYLSLALKTQNQCRATIQTLAKIKRPATVIAQQANVSTGMQQVNNHAATPQQPAPKEKIKKVL